MGCEQVCLKWNNFSLNITKNIDDLWKDESLVDVSVISDGQCIQAHKVILSASSPLFKSLFAVNPCQHPVIILQDVRYQELVSIISFIYKGEVNILEENLPALLQAAKTLQIRGLSDSVDRDSLNRITSLRNDQPERSTKKRRITESQPTEESVMSVSTESIIPKEEPKLENFPVDFLSCVSDDETEVKEESIHDRTQEILQAEICQSDVRRFNTIQWLNSDPSGVGVTEEWTGPSGYPCPFCTRKYMTWGYRRRHIKAMHCQNDGLTYCKLCPPGPNNSFTLEEWIYHMLDEHKAKTNDVQNEVAIFKEANTVLGSKNVTGSPKNV